MGIDQNVGIWLENKELIRILKFEYNKAGSIKMLKFEWKRGDWSNVDILLPKWELIKMLEFNWKIRKWSERWNLRTTLRIDQNVIIWVQNVKSIKMLKFEWKGKIDQYVKFEWKGGINKTLKFEDKLGNQSKCGNLSANHQIVQNVVFWVKSGE